MNGKKWNAVLIPDVGDARHKNGYAAPEYAKASAEFEARLLFKDERVQNVEIVILHGREAQAEWSQMISRDRICPRCRRGLLPVALFEDVWGCSSCKETWHLPKGGRP